MDAIEPPERDPRSLPSAPATAAQGTTMPLPSWPAQAQPRPPKPPFDRERFVFRTIAAVIACQLSIYAVAAGVCGQRALQNRPIGQICPGTLDRLQGGFEVTLNLLLALLGGAALTRSDSHR